MKSSFGASVVLIIFLEIIIVRSNSIKADKEQSNTKCGKIFDEKQFVLTSENYPLPYPPNKECFYLLKGGNCTTHFNVEYLDFMLLNSIGCVKERLEVGRQDALCGIRNGSKVYTSERGSLKLKFISDRVTEESNRGFRLFVTRIDTCTWHNQTTGEVVTVPNKDFAEDTTEPVQYEWTTKTVFAKPRPTYLPPTLQTCCQNNIFSSNTFLLVSPHFPYSTNTPTDCTYIIRKASSLVCRLRINILFFSLGPSTQNSCPYGHLEIDGKFVCGCNSDLQLNTNFHNSESKVLRFHSAGYRTNDASGFVLEVIQDECQKSYSPDDEYSPKLSPGKFRFYEDQSNKVNWPPNNNIDQLKLVNERSYHIPKDDRSVDSQFGSVVKHFYFFAPEDEEDRSWTHTKQDKEETNTIEITTINTLLTNFYNYEQCIRWNTNQLRLLQTRFGNSLNQMCISSSQSTGSQETNCLILSSLTGTILSPGYPVSYPANKNVCYRFNMLPGYCGVKIFFKEFQIERSYDCLKDYLAINQYRYCGTYLTNQQVTITTAGNSHQDLKFVSDGNYCGKGFSALYQQLQCQKPADNSITPNCNPVEKNADERPHGCGIVISDKHFVIRNDIGASLCTYDVTRYSENVCKIRLYFDRFNLPCEIETITINGRVFCGDRSSQSIILDFLGSLSIIYKRNNRYPFDPNSRFVIRVEQIDTDCDFPGVTPEPARLNSSPVRNAISSSNKMFSYPDVCALLRENITAKELPYKICHILTKYHNVTQCNFTKAMLVDLPNSTANGKKIRLLSEKSNKFDYKEIECENT